MKPGVLIRDIDWSDVDSDDLGKMLRDIVVLTNFLDEMGQYAPLVRQSDRFPKGIVENTAIGETFDDLRNWLLYQMEEAYETLRENPPTKPGFAESRALDIVEYMARHTGFLVNIATDALKLEADPMTALPRAEATWVKRYLKERVAHV